jgi:hypothetical protein
MNGIRQEYHEHQLIKPKLIKPKQYVNKNDNEYIKKELANELSYKRRKLLLYLLKEYN